MQFCKAQLLCLLQHSPEQLDNFGNEDEIKGEITVMCDVHVCVSFGVLPPSPPLIQSFLLTPSLPPLFCFLLAFSFLPSFLPHVLPSSNLPFPFYINFFFFRRNSREYSWSGE